MDDSSTTDSDSLTLAHSVASILGIKGALRFRPHGSTQKPHVILRRVAVSDDSSDDGEGGNTIRFSLFAQKRIEVKPGKEILLSVAAGNGLFKEQPVVLEGDLMTPEDVSDEEGATQVADEEDILLPPIEQAIPPKMRRAWTKKNEDTSSKTCSPDHPAGRRLSVSVQVEPPPHIQKSIQVEPPISTVSVSVQVDSLDHLKKPAAEQTRRFADAEIQTDRVSPGEPSTSELGSWHIPSSVGSISGERSLSPMELDSAPASPELSLRFPDEEALSLDSSMVTQLDIPPSVPPRSSSSSPSSRSGVQQVQQTFSKSNSPLDSSSIASSSGGNLQQPNSSLASKAGADPQASTTSFIPKLEESETQPPLTPKLSSYVDAGTIEKPATCSGKPTVHNPFVSAGFLTEFVDSVKKSSEVDTSAEWRDTEMAPAKAHPVEPSPRLQSSAASSSKTPLGKTTPTKPMHYIRLSTSRAYEKSPAISGAPIPQRKADHLKHSPPPPDVKSLAYVSTGPSSNPLNIRPSSTITLQGVERPIPTAPKTLSQAITKKRVVVGATWPPVKVTQPMGSVTHLPTSSTYSTPTPTSTFTTPTLAFGTPTPAFATPAFGMPTPAFATPAFGTPTPISSAFATPTPTSSIYTPPTPTASVYTAPTPTSSIRATLFPASSTRTPAASVSSPIDLQANIVNKRSSSPPITPLAARLQPKWTPVVGGTAVVSTLNGNLSKTQSGVNGTPVVKEDPVESKAMLLEEKPQAISLKDRPAPASGDTLAKSENSALPVQSNGRNLRSRISEVFALSDSRTSSPPSAHTDGSPQTLSPISPVAHRSSDNDRGADSRHGSTTYSNSTPPLSSPVNTANPPLNHPLPPKPMASPHVPNDRGAKRDRANSPDRSRKRRRAYRWPTVDSSYSTRLAGDEQVGIRSIAFNSDGNLFALCCADRTVRIWNSRSKTEIARLAHNAPILSVVWTQGDTGVVSLAEDGLISKWTRTGVNHWHWSKVLDAGKNERRAHDQICLAYARDRIAVSFPRIGVKVWAWMKGNWHPQRSILRQNVTAIKFVNEGAALIGGTRDGVLWHCDIPNGTLRAFAFLQRKIQSLDLALPDILVAAGTHAKIVTMEGVVVEKSFICAETEARPNDGFGAIFATEGQAVLFGDVDGCVVVWDRKSGDIVYGLEHDEGDTIQAVASFEGPTNREGFLITGTKNGQLSWWSQPLSASHVDTLYK